MTRKGRQTIEIQVLEAVRRVNADLADHRESVYTLAEMLERKNVASLRRIGKLCKLSGLSKMNKPTLISALAGKLASPEILSGHLLVLEPHEWEFFKQAAKERQLTNDELLSANYRFMLEIGIMALFFHDGHFHYVVPREIREAFQEIEKTGFPAEKEHGDLLNSYAVAAVHLYGVISQDDFVALFNSQNERQIDIDDMFGTLIRYVAMGYGYCFWKDYIVNDDLEENDYETVEPLAESAAAKPRYLPGKEELLKYSDWGYIEVTPQLLKLREFIRRLIPGGGDLADDLLKQIHEYGNYEATPETYIGLFTENKKPLNPKHIKEILPLIFGLRNNTRLWMNNGHTLSELSRGKNNNLQAPPNEPVRTAKVGRNDLCPCGSGKKYKKCCGG